MTIFVINIGDTKYSDYSLKFIEKFCDFNNVNLYVLDRNISQNIYNLHPSWLKLFAFDFVKDDFIISWDLDLIPTKLYKLDNTFNTKLLNFCYDRSYETQGFTFNGKFKYNCGLMGIPETYSDLFKKIYIDKGMNTKYPSYEQYHINDWVHDNKINVNLLDSNLNYMFEGHENFAFDILNIHYTWKIKSNEHRVELIKKHFLKYKNNFNL